ncbi:outer membrane protein assembly factor BamB family protein [Gimesia fumaroli]|uniref:Outer membrane biogenesis protein BamB n=1 Tax=Gimesia fumaroli TaxID=2527976 RepID=A0A518IE03_9PLAN|nr:PQQ-binding-like beta-propeller repeat protein [Gimesia fumaroli]QDV51326.1 outer membrane biogenesis protein BamB [Gimesia fumaroli]
MASLEISFLSGKTQVIELSKQQPVSIGSHASNDLQIKDDGVASMQCRISWNKKSYEALAATSDGIEINGTMSGRSLLKDGDLIRIGEADILFVDEVDLLDLNAPLPDVTGDQESSMYDLKPVSQDMIQLKQNKSKQPEETEEASSKSTTKPASKTESKSKKKKSSKTKKEKKPPEPEEFSEDELISDDDDDLDLVSAAELLVEVEPDQPVSAAPKPFLSRSKEQSTDEPDEPETAAQPDKSSTLSLKDRIRHRSSRNAVRPGERQIVRSPLVLSLTGGAVLLTLTALTFWFIIGRDTAKRHYDAAVQEMEAGKYAQAIQLFEYFLENYNKSDYSDEARILLSKSLVEKEISGSTPAWNAGLDATNKFIKKHRDDANFKELYPTLVDYGQRIALGAVETASRTKERELLTVSKNAETILTRYSPQDAPPTEMLARIKSSYEKAEAEILRKEVFDVAVNEIEAALKQKNTLQAIQRRRLLLDRYPYYKNDRKMATTLAKILETEKSLIQVNNKPVTASVEEYPDQFPQAVTLALHTRSRSNQISDGRNVFALANGSCFGIDSVTGDPIWRRPIGQDSPFAPITFSGKEPSLLLYDTRHQELLSVTQKDGQLVWRQKLPSPPSGKPLIHQGLIVVACRSGDLLNMDLLSGNINSQLKFAQPLVGAPGLVYGEQAVAVAGYEAVVYLVSLRPFECQKVASLGHRPGTVQIPIISMGKLLLVCENDRADSALLHVLDGNGENATLNELEQFRIKGHVQSMPVLRGKQLFFPTVPERITAFTVTDEEGKRKLSEIASYQLQDPLSCQIYLSAGSGGQLWMSSSALRKFTLMNTGIKMDKKKIADGLGSQPMQLIGNNLYLARRLLSSNSVIFTIANRDEMSSTWKSILGTDILATYPYGDKQTSGLLCLTSDGDIFRLRDSDFAADASSFIERTITQLKLPEGLTAPLKTTQFENGKIAVSCGLPEPTLWILNSFGQLEQTIELKAPLYTMPILLGDGIALPFEKKIAVFRKGRGLNTVQEFVLPENIAADAKWKQLIPVSKDQCIAITSTGQIISLQYRTTPVRHLAVLSIADLKQPIDFKAAKGTNLLAITDASGQLQLLDAKTTQVKAKHQLPTPATNDLWIMNDLLFVESKQNLSCFSMKEGLQKSWDLKLPDSSLAGAPSMIDKQLLLSLQNGTLLSVDPQSGQIHSKADVPLPASGSIVNLEKLFVVPTVDGSLYRIDQVLQQKGQASL